MSFKNSIVLLFFALTCSCATRLDSELRFSPDKPMVYYEYKNDMLFYISFNKNLDREITLQKVYFRANEAVIQELNHKDFVANFNTKNDLIFDQNTTKEYGNNALSITKPKFQLQPNEAVLEYQMNHKTYFYKIINIQERQ